MGIDHTGIIVPADKHAAAVEFYLAALAPLGYAKGLEFHDGAVVGFADTKLGGINWWVTSRAVKPAGDNGKDIVPGHHAFSASDRASVDAFYQAAVAAGAKDNGAPGPRAHYGPNYYGAFVIDPAGNNIEAVCRLAPPA
ncbi:Glyoxalase/Bleomycin resistance protein/Dihydroxybiphenyl dioxygenase [Lasiosphaeria ovina]|uniref:Glyoxalase/Bleomycin resistance protein/Dihydroxybiphenyl dioxygenase n=1 Tax=Lasiosphaeria ovina TaxID=92902 RepID=A0AAE0KHJ3_9PEZI|nr:Glyoxalase/Bleomycin resistance protein/Dihydroxybiphenyl dioxygenase [Lasiosphaeria ovina]